MIKKTVRLLVQISLLFFFIVGFANLIWWNIGENNRIENEKASEHIQMLNENRASRGIK